MRAILLLYCFLYPVFFAQSCLGQETYEDLIKATLAGQVEVVQRLVSRGMAVDTSDPAGNTLLIMAAREGQLEVARYLISQKAGINARNGAGDTPLQVAALKGHLPIVQLLRAAGVEVNQPGWTALHYCAWEGQVDVCNYLIEQGAAVNALAPNGTTPLMMAARQGHIPMVKLLLAKGADPAIRNDADATAAAWALKAGHTDTAEILTTGATRR